MPITVAQLTNELVRDLKLESIDGTGAQTEFKTLDGEIDAGLAALNGAKTAAAFTAAEKQYGDVFRDLGFGAFGVGSDLDRDAAVFGAIDRYLGGAPSKTATGTQADFLSFDTLLDTTSDSLQGAGGDLFALGSLRSQSGLAGAEKKVAGDAGTLSTDFATLGGDVTKIVNDLTGSSGGGNPQPAVVAASPYAGVAAALTPLAAEFEALSTDFGHLASLLSGTGTGGSGSGTTLSAAVVVSGSGSGGPSPLTYDGVFASIDTDFLSLDKSLQGLAGPLANLILGSSGGTTTTPTGPVA